MDDRKHRVLAVDLDHTLINCDLTFISLLRLWKRKKCFIFFLPFWMVRGKGHLKEKLSQYVAIDVHTLPYRPETLSYIANNSAAYHKVVLATASHKVHAYAIAQHFTKTAAQYSGKKSAQSPLKGVVFDDVMATNSDYNLSSHNKAKKLVERFGKGAFDYIGDHPRDIPVWEASALAIVVSPKASLERKTRHLKREII